MAAQGMLQPPARNEPHTTDAEHWEWEYEYDQNETEDIYFTLDLTTHVPNAIQEKQYAKNGKLIGGANVAANEDAPQGDATLTLIGANEEADPQNKHVTNTPAITEASTLQILDLHTEKPYVKFNNGFYSCQWFTDLGTQFWITNPGVVSDPKLSGHVLDVVGSSQTRLVAKPANLKRKRDAKEAEPSIEGQTAAHSIEINNDEAASDVSDAESRSHGVDIQHDQDPNKAMIIPRQKIRDPHLASQANFMERLSELKLNKGEKDAHRIPLKVPVYYKGARNIDALRAAHSINVDEFPKPAGTPTGDPISPAPAPEEDIGEGAQADEDSPAPASAPAPPVIPKLLPRKRGRPGGGAISHAARRSNLGLELVNEAPPKPRKKRGRPSNADKVLRAQLAAAAAEPPGSNTFALDPQLGGAAQAQAGADTPADDDDIDNASVSARSTSREVSAAACSVQGSQTQAQAQTAGPPRKRRRNPEQMEEARRLDEERQAKLVAAKLAKAGARREEDASKEDPMTVLGKRSARRTRASNVAGEEKSGDGDAVVDPQLEG